MNSVTALSMQSEKQRSLREVPRCLWDVLAFDDVTILAWGEFGRTPKVNSKGGRDHWPQAAMGIMAGGGMNVGQVIGSTDKIASEVTSRPIHYRDVLATLYHNLGLDPSASTITDLSGRPRYLLDDADPIRELVG
jgi:hypothetical protein